MSNTRVTRSISERRWGASHANVAALTVLALGMGQCADTTPVWQAAQDELPGAVLSVWGTSAQDVYFVGSDSRDGSGPTALRFDGSSWRRMNTGLTSGDLWWVAGIGSDYVYMVGSGGVILQRNARDGVVTRMPTPGSATLFGIWGTRTDDLWAVGSNPVPDPGQNQGVVWHYDGTAWQSISGLPSDAVVRSALYKVWGSAANDVWVVGGGSSAMHWDGAQWSSVATGTTGQRLLTVHGSGSQRFAVGGLGTGVILEVNGTAWQPVAADTLPGLNGVFVPETGAPIAVGGSGVVVRRSNEGWREIPSGPTPGRDFHAVWMSGENDIWCVGGNIASEPLSHGTIWHFGPRMTAGAITGP